jgi:hypothetical protein
MIQRWARGDTVGLGGAESLNQVFADFRRLVRCLCPVSLDPGSIIDNHSISIMIYHDLSWSIMFCQSKSSI